jgi:hypothetical protein
MVTAMYNLYAKLRIHFGETPLVYMPSITIYVMGKHSGATVQMLLLTSEIEQATGILVLSPLLFDQVPKTAICV